MTHILTCLLTLFFLSGPVIGENSDFRCCTLAWNGLRTTTEVGKAASGQVIAGTRTVQDKDSRGNLILSTMTTLYKCLGARPEVLY